MFGDVYIYFREAEPGTSFEFLCQHPRGPLVFFEVENLSLPAGHVSEHLFANSGVFILVVSDLCFSSFVVAREHEVGPPTTASFNISYASLFGL